MVVNGTNLYMTRGDTEFIGVNFSNYTLKPGDIIEFTVRNWVNGEVILNKKLTSLSGNKAVISIEPKDTENLNFSTYVYDIQLTYDGGKVKTIVTPSEFVIGEEVTYGY